MGTTGGGVSVDEIDMSDFVRGEELEALVNAPEVVQEASLSLPAMEADGAVTLQEVARQLGRDRTALGKRARTLGCRLEYRHVRDGRGCRQKQLCTDAAGVAALKKWYGQ
jgi:hypothetical protein